MLTLALAVRIAVVGAVVTTAGFAMFGSQSSEGFGVIREGAAGTAPAAGPALPQRLTQLRATLGIEPAQAAAWDTFAGRMLDLDQVSQRIDRQTRPEGTNVADERARHALQFAIALSDMDHELSTRQSAVLQREIRALGSGFICAEVRGQES